MEGRSEAAARRLTSPRQRDFDSLFLFIEAEENGDGEGSSWVEKCICECEIEDLLERPPNPASPTSTRRLTAFSLSSTTKQQARNEAMLGGSTFSVLFCLSSLRTHFQCVFQREIRRGRRLGVRATETLLQSQVALRFVRKETQCQPKLLLVLGSVGVEDQEVTEARGR